MVLPPGDGFIALLFKTILADAPLRVYSTNTMPLSFDHDYYVVVRPDAFSRMPPPSKTMCFQRGHISSGARLAADHLKTLTTCLAVADSCLDNIEELTNYGIPWKNIFYLPIHPISTARIARNNTVRDIDVLFLDETRSTRQQSYAVALGGHVQLRMERHGHGDDLRGWLERAKVVVVIHSHDAGSLDTALISEALTYGASVVAEKGTDYHCNAEFAGLVDLIEPNDVAAFVARVSKAIEAWRGPVEIAEDSTFWSTRYFLFRLLHGAKVLSFAQIDHMSRAMTFRQDKVVLCQPEQISRFTAAMANALRDSELFAGLRNDVSWKGCAESYKFMARRALACRDGYFTIYEDDSLFQGDTYKRLETIYSYLENNAGNWDIFSGLLCDLSYNAGISRAEAYRGEEFIYLDKIIGTHFGIYTRSALSLIAMFEIAGDDPFRHTIDRYLEGMSLRIVTTLSPLVMENADVPSSLWERSNGEAAERIQNSILRLRTKWASHIDLARGRAWQVVRGDTAALREVRHHGTTGDTAGFVAGLAGEFARMQWVLARTDEFPQWRASEIEALKHYLTEEIRSLREDMVASGEGEAALPPDRGRNISGDCIDARSGAPPVPDIRASVDATFLQPFYESVGLHGEACDIWQRLSVKGQRVPRRRAEAELAAALVRQSGLFEAELYAARLPKGLDPALHYVVVGERLGWPPSDRFDPTYYLRRYPDVGFHKVSPLYHYHTTGRLEGRRPIPVSFDIPLPSLAAGPLRPVVVVLAAGTGRDEARRGRDLCREMHALRPVIALIVGEAIDPFDLDEVCDAAIGPIARDPQYSIEAEAIAQRISRVYDPSYVILFGTMTFHLAACFAAQGLQMVALMPSGAAGLASDRSAFEWIAEIVFLTHSDAESAFHSNPWMKRRRGIHIVPYGIFGKSSSSDRTGGGGVPLPEASDVVRMIELWGRDAAARNLTEDARSLRASGLVDRDLALPSGNGLPSGTAVEDRIVYLWNVNGSDAAQEGAVHVRRPLPGFNPQAFAEAHPEPCLGDRRDPTARWLEAGRPAGPWSRPFFIPGRTIDAPPKGMRAALHAHFFDVGVAHDFARRLKVNMSACDLFLSTDTPRKAEMLRQVLAGSGAKIQTLVVPESGRDLAPLITAFGAEILGGGYDVCGHLHCMSNAGAWRNFLWDNLMGNERPLIDFILSIFAQNSRCGLVMAEDPYCGGWAGNRDIARHIAENMGLEFAPPAFFDFPMGSMFWFRPAVLRRLFSLNLSWDAYEAQPLFPSGSLLGAVERLIPFVVTAEAFEIAGVRVPGTTR